MVNFNVRKQEDTDAIRNSLGQLSSLTGALKIHEIFIGEDLVVKKKMLPNDPFYKAVLINVMVVGFQPKGRKRFVYTRSLEIEEKDSRALWGPRPPWTWDP